MARLIISGGGTGGHVFPAIAIADAIKLQSPESEILFVGALGKIEMEKVHILFYNSLFLIKSGNKKEKSGKISFTQRN